MPSASDHQSHASSNRHDPVPLCMAKKWLPVTHRHGCAIYWHQNVTADEQGNVGGELMVSAIIKGTPQQCLDALTGSRCGNSILGPVTAIEVLQQSAGSSDKVLHLDLAPLSSCNHSSSSSPSSNAARQGSNSSNKGSHSSKAGLLTGICSRLVWPRCAVLQQKLWQDPTGIHCLTFSSLPEQEAYQLLQQQQQQQPVHNAHHAHSNGTNSSCSSNGVGENMDHQLQQQQQQQRDGQQQLRRRHSSSDQPTAKQQVHQQQVRLHAVCHNGSNNLRHSPQQQQQQQHNHHGHRQAKAQPQRQQQVQQQRSAANRFLVQPVQLLLSWLGSMLALLSSLIGLRGGNSRSSSSSSSSSWRLCGPVLVNVRGGFTVAGLESADDADSNSETLVTSILKVDLGGCLSSTAPGPCRWIHNAAVRVGVVDQLVLQLLSGLEGVKRELEQPQAEPTQHSSQHQGQQQAHRQQGGTSLGLLQGVMSALTSLASLAAAPLTAWQSQQRPNPKPYHSHRPGDTQQDHSQFVSYSSAPGRLGGANSTGSWGGSVGGGVEGSGGGGGLVADLVGQDQLGRPLTGTCRPAFWSPLHQPGCPALFQVRGPSYLSDHVKAAAGDCAYSLLAVDLVSTPSAVHHLARFLPSVRRSRAASCFVINMMVPAANDVMNLVMTFGSNRPWPVQVSNNSSRVAGASSHGNSAPGVDPGGSSKGSSRGSSSRGGSGAGSRPAGDALQSSSSSSGSTSGSAGSGGGVGGGFQNTLRRFLLADDQERSNMFKMIPHIQVGPWVMSQMVGTTPVIMGRKLATTYHLTEHYMEVDIDVTTCRTAGFIVQSIRGATTSLVVDLCYLLEGQRPDELPEELIGAVRFSNIDMSATTPLDTSTEIPCWPQPW